MNMLLIILIASKIGLNLHQEILNHIVYLSIQLLLCIVNSIKSKNKTRNTLVGSRPPGVRLHIRTKELKLSYIFDTLISQ